MSRRGVLGFGVVAVASVLVNCGGRLQPDQGPDFGGTGGAGGAAGSPGDGVGGLGSGATGGSTGGAGGSGASGGSDGSGGFGAAGGTAGSTAGTGMGGSGGNGGSSTTDGGSGNPFVDLLPDLNLSPICRSCISNQCTEVVAKCSFTPGCVAGTACTSSSCFSFNDTACVLKCFNGDIALAQGAVQAAACIYGLCGSQCR
jgi:hypothetical protein